MKEMKMKAIKTTLWMMALMLVPVSFVACSDDDDDEESSSGSSSELLGTWVSYYYAEEYYVNGTRVSIEDSYEATRMFVFNEDGTGINYEYYSNSWYADGSFTWWLSDDYLYCQYDEDEIEVATVTKLTSTTLQLLSTETYTSGDDVYMTAYIVYYKKQTEE